MKKVSIITPCYNSSAYLLETYQCLNFQSHSNWEWIVVDDCSTDNSLKILEDLKARDKRVKVFKNSQNSGAAITRNNSLDNATGDYVAFLDSDDLWESDKLEKQVKFAEENQAEYTYHNYWTIDGQGNRLKEQIVASQVKQSDLYKFNPFATSSIMIKRDVLEKNQIRFRRHLRRRQDYFFWFDAIGVCNKACGLPEKLSSYRIFGGDSLSANKKKMAVIQWQLLQSEFKLGPIKAFYYFVHYAIHGLKKYFL
jgi:teichuronic acid biosynthesis glycosyltransferase TuaG